MWIWLPRCLGGTEDAQGVDVDVMWMATSPRRVTRLSATQKSPCLRSRYSQLVEHLSFLPEYKDTFSADLRVFRISFRSK